MKRNCWEYRNCGRGPGGRFVERDGLCVAATFEAADGYLGGTNAGRACCFVAGTLCDEAIQGTYRDKSKDCWDCEFFRDLRREHGAAFSMPGFALFLFQRDPEMLKKFIRENQVTPRIAR